MDLQRIQQFNADQAAQAEKDQEAAIEQAQTDQVVGAVKNAGLSAEVSLAKVSGEVKRGADTVTSSVDKNTQEFIKWTEQLLKAIQQVAKDITIPEVELPETVTVSNFPKFPEFPKNVSVDNLSAIEAYFGPVVEAIDKLPKEFKFDPQITVSPTPVTVDTQQVDLKPLLKAIEALKQPAPVVNVPEIDQKPLIEAMNKVGKTIAGLQFPVPNYVLPFKGAVGEATQAAIPFINQVYDEYAPSGYDSFGVPSTIVYKYQGTTVATLTITSSSGNITGVVRS